jgi:hypothetical protein
MTCPNRDGSKGTGGCTFCNNASFSPNEPGMEAAFACAPMDDDRDACPASAAQALPGSLPKIPGARRSPDVPCLN